jgi:ribosomal protein S7
MTAVLLNRIIEKTFSQLAKADQQCLQDLVLQKFEVIDEPRLEKIVSRLTGDILRQTKVAGWPKLNECIVKLRK